VRLISFLYKLPFLHLFQFKLESPTMASQLTQRQELVFCLEFCARCLDAHPTAKQLIEQAVRSSWQLAGTYRREQMTEAGQPELAKSAIEWAIALATACQETAQNLPEKRLLDNILRCCRLALRGTSVSSALTPRQPDHPPPPRLRSGGHKRTRR